MRTILIQIYPKIYATWSARGLISLTKEVNHSSVGPQYELINKELILLFKRNFEKTAANTF